MMTGAYSKNTLRVQKSRWVDVFSGFAKDTGEGSE